MIDPLDMAARYADAARACRDPVPCGWCLWRAGYRKGRRPRLPRFPRASGGDLDLFTPGPAVSGSNERTRPMTDTTTLWHIRFDGHDTLTSGAATKRRAIEDAAARLDLPGGVRRCRVWRTTDGLPTGAAQTVDVSITRAVSVEIVRGAASADTSSDGSGE